MTTTPERTATLTDLVAAEIRSWLGRLDVRPAELARRMGENDQWLSTRLKGRTPINLNDMHRIAKALGLQVHQLMPPPEVAAGAASPPAIPRYLDLTVRRGTAPALPRDNRPPAGPGNSHPAGTGRTAYLSRHPGGRRD